MTQNQLVNITTRGGVITAEFLENMKTETVRNPLIKPQTFVTFNKPAPENQSKLDEQIYISFKNLVERWDAISNFYENMDISDTRKKWIIPVLRELGFDPQFNREDVLVEGDERLKFKLSHRGWVSPKAPLIQTVVAKQELEVKHMDSGRRRSPHDEMQTFLNVNKDHKWGVVTNGILFRILRDFFHTTTKGYVEFDVENIMRSRNYHEFMAFYRIAHASRFLEDEGGISPLEQFYKESVAVGVKVGQNLQGNVKRAIEVLGNGFLTPEHIQQMIEDEEFSKSYYSEILRVIYRILFLLYAEQRAMLPTRDSLYIEEYGITHLREIAERLKREDNYYDLWEGLKVTFEMLSKGCEPLQVFPYNGSLFDDANIPTIQELKIKNHDLLEAIRCLTLIEEERLLKRINYLDLGVEEIGSIYESLLDFTPRVVSSDIEIDNTRVPANRFFLDPRGCARKTTGSYYTNPQLVDELIKSALKPVTERKLEESEDKEEGLLSLKVCDPACGSGAFLIAATNYLGKELARIRTEQSEPPDEDMRRARRDVLQHCIYGVDLNPMALELAKVSLWIDAAVRDLPLNFLDHHIKCGNSLIGASPELIEKGIPDKAFNPVEGDDKTFAKKIKDKNKNERKQWTLGEFEKKEKHTWAIEYGRLSEINETDIHSVKEKQECYNAIIDSPIRHHEKLIADGWCAAFFWPLQKDAPLPPTEANLRMMREDITDDSVDIDTKSNILELADKYRFFHWHLEFPDVFEREENGFDCVLGNPPWEKIKIMEREWFEGVVDEIANSGSKSKRMKLIEQLKESNPYIYKKWKETLEKSERTSSFINKSESFPLSGVGDLNTYPIFTELAGLKILNHKGRMGMVVKTGIATDYYTQNIFSHLVENKLLVSLYDFVNSERIFTDVAPVEHFCLLTITGKDNQLDMDFEFSFYNANFDMQSDESRRYKLTKKDIEKINPNTGNCPVFKTKEDASLTKHIYSIIPILVNKKTKSNPWGIKYSQMFHMTNDSYLFVNNTKEVLESKGYILGNDGIFRKRNDIYLPLYEAKNINLYNHRFGTFEGIPSENRFITRAQPHTPSLKQKQNFDYEIEPRYWMEESCFKSNNSINWNKEWVFSFRSITRSTTDTRSTMGTIIPFSPIVNSASLFTFEREHPEYYSLLFSSIFLSFTFDYVLRQKLGGTNLNLFILEQLPMPTPEKVSSYNIHYKHEVKKLDIFLIERAAKLIITSNSLKSILDELALKDGPYVWNDKERKQLMWEIDAAVAHLYNLDRDMYAHIFTEFRIQKDKDVVEYGTFMTKEKCLELFDEILLEKSE